MIPQPCLWFANLGILQPSDTLSQVPQTCLWLRTPVFVFTNLGVLRPSDTLYEVRQNCLWLCKPVCGSVNLFAAPQTCLRFREPVCGSLVVPRVRGPLEGSRGQGPFGPLRVALRVCMNLYTFLTPTENFFGHENSRRGSFWSNSDFSFGYFFKPVPILRSNRP